MDPHIRQAAFLLSRSKRVTALTGAGISVESGIPPFRGKEGVWEKFDPIAFGHIDAFLKNPEMIWREFLSKLVSQVAKAKPNDGHIGLARLEQMGILKTVITQNLDGLHQKAGNMDVIEFHGNFASFFCLNCLNRTTAGQLDLSKSPPRCDCGGIFRPDCVFFGEAIPPPALQRSHEIAANCDVMLVVGTSAEVQPAAYMPVVAKNSGAKVIEINRESTPLTGSVSEILLKGKASHIMTQLVNEILALNRAGDL